ncbi:hypothetical protein DPEC_G00188260 [Dallia pectoralis]|uniref:Uncharacterized protein n=1 Tax=Dallia pectoralis TaxID=75939 RepID=A0ACC2GC19_DALPE|nr:hypothetical protein DPEC_G00188260 [Dallia pectoralis]
MPMRPPRQGEIYTVPSSVHKSSALLAMENNLEVKKTWSWSDRHGARRGLVSSLLPPCFSSMPSSCQSRTASVTYSISNGRRGRSQPGRPPNPTSPPITTD